MSGGVKKNEGGGKRPKPDSSPGTDEPNVSDLVKSLALQMAQQMASINENIASLRTEMHTELANLNEVMGNWQEEKKIILQKQSELESRLDRLERQGRKKKVVITGMEEPKAGTSTSAAVNFMIKEKLDPMINVCDAYVIRLKSGQSKIIAEFKSIEDKQIIMRNKKSLTKGIYINDDLTQKDQHQRFKARELIRSKGPDAKDVRIKSGSVSINGAIYVWDQEKLEYLLRKN